MGARLIEFVCGVDLVAWHGVMQDRVLESPNIRELVAREGEGRQKPNCVVCSRSDKNWQAK